MRFCVCGSGIFTVLCAQNVLIRSFFVSPVRYVFVFECICWSGIFSTKNVLSISLAMWNVEDLQLMKYMCFAGNSWIIFRSFVSLFVLKILFSWVQGTWPVNDTVNTTRETQITKSEKSASSTECVNDIAIWWEEVWHEQWENRRNARRNRKVTRTNVKVNGKTKGTAR